jgi:hypothetical protein
MMGACECGAAGGQYEFFRVCGVQQDPCATTTTTLP